MRRISLPIHALVELVAGLALVVGAFALAAGTAGTVLLFIAGVALAWIGLGAADALPLAVHRSLDGILVVGLALGAVLAAFTGGGVAAGVLLAMAVLQLVLVGATHWVRAPLAR